MRSSSAPNATVPSIWPRTINIHHSIWPTTIHWLRGTLGLRPPSVLAIRPHTTWSSLLAISYHTRSSSMHAAFGLVGCSNKNKTSKDGANKPRLYFHSKLQEGGFDDSHGGWDFLMDHRKELSQFWGSNIQRHPAGFCCWTWGHQRVFAWPHDSPYSRRRKLRSVPISLWPMKV